MSYIFEYVDNHIQNITDFVKVTYFYIVSAVVFSALHGLSARTSNEKGVCLSVCPYVKCMDCYKTEERYVWIFMPYERPFSLVF